MKLVLALALAFSIQATAGTVKREARALGSPEAVPGGELRLRYNLEPKSLNPIVSEGSGALEIDYYMIEGLLMENEDTLEWEPWLADSWSVSKDGRVHEFHLREDAVWSDGVPVTSADVKFSFDVLFDERYPSAHLRPYYESIEKVEVVDRKRVRFTTKTNYFGNFFSTAGLPILPQHIYGDPERGPKLSREIVGSGPYKLEAWNEGRNIVLVKNPRWWGWHDPLYRGKFQPERQVFQFVADDNVALEMLKKGQLDYLSLTPDQYLLAKKSEGATYQTARVQSNYPEPVTSMGFNLRRPLFQDRQVRLAIAHLFDRDMMIAKLFNGFMQKATGPWYRQSEFADSSRPEISYDPSAAFEILREAGWEDRDHKGVLSKEGIGPLKFTVIVQSRASERYLTIFKEDARKVGVQVDIKLLSPTAFDAQLDSGNFDAADLVSGGWMVEFDPKPSWHSKSAEPGGLNFMHYASPEVDQLIDQARQITDFQARIPSMRAIYKKIADDLPAVFLFNGSDTFYAHSNRVGLPAPTFNYDLGLKFWWIKSEVAR